MYIIQHIAKKKKKENYTIIVFDLLYLNEEHEIFKL